MTTENQFIIAIDRDMNVNGILAATQEYLLQMTVLIADINRVDCLTREQRAVFLPILTTNLHRLADAIEQATEEPTKLDSTNPA